MMARTRTSLRTCVLLALLSWTRGQQNLALNQPTAQYTTLNYAGCNGTTGSGNKAVDASTTAICGCSHTLSLTDTPLLMRPWWLVQLKRWARFVSMRFTYRNDSCCVNDLRNIGYTFYIAPFWNRTLWGTVAANATISDPFVGKSFSFLYQNDVNMGSTPNWYNVTSTATGRYFAVRSSNPIIPLIICEIEVYGDTNWLLNVMPALTVADFSPYQSYNWSLLNDEDETTCLTMLDPSVSRSVQLAYSATKPARFLVTVVVSGTVQPQQKGTACSVGTFIGVTVGRLINGAIATDYICQFSDTRSDETKSYHNFICDCSTCTGNINILLSRNAASGVDAASLCEVLAFNY